MAYLIDTNILIYHLNGITNAAELLDRLLDSGAAMSVLSYTEIADGIQDINTPEVELQRFAALKLGLPVIIFDEHSAEEAARIRYQLRSQGRSIRPRAIDLLIAATAIAHDLTLITSNPADFIDVPGLRLEIANLNV